jgi:hypothetical protein
MDYPLPCDDILTGDEVLSTPAVSQSIINFWISLLVVRTGLQITLTAQFRSNGTLYYVIRSRQGLMKIWNELQELEPVFQALEKHSVMLEFGGFMEKRIFRLH